jgi:hypothetical protein
MSYFSRILGMIVLGSVFALPYMATTKGWGIQSERNAKLIADTANNCPSNQKDPLGKCRRSLRSNSGLRSSRGGPSWGK